jgi:MFS family permease
MSFAETASPGRLAAGRLVPWAALLIVAAAVLLGYFTVRAFNQAVEPELNKRSRLIGTIVRTNIQRALDLGIPLNQLRGTEKYLTNILETFPEVSRLAIRAKDRKIVSLAERSAGGIATYHINRKNGEGQAQPSSITPSAFTFPILTRNTVVGDIVIEGDRAYVERQFRDVFLDVLVVVLVAVLVAFEVMLAVVTASVSKPLDRLHLLLERQSQGDFSGRLRHEVATSLDRVAARFSDHSEDLSSRFARLLGRCSGDRSDPSSLERLDETGQRFGLTGDMPAPIRLTDVVDMRLPLFLFVIAEELSKPFLPLYIQAAMTGEGWISKEIVISLPLVAYLVALAALSPVAGFITERYSRRQTFLAALLPVAISHVGLSLSDSVAEIVLWRGVAGAGYAVATIACQDYALGAIRGGLRARAIGSFVAVIIGGTFCGTAIGGVLADRIGQSNVFLVGAGLVCIAGLMALPMLSREHLARLRRTESSTSAGGMLSAFANLRFVTLLFGIAIPANVLVAAFLWYLVPLMLADVGSSPADIGRALMLYYLVIVLVAPPVTQLIGRPLSANAMVVVGGLVSGLALVIVTHWHGFWPIAAAVAIAGIGHSLIRVSQIEIALQIDETITRGAGAMATLGALRTFERAGSIIGLLLAAIVASELGYIKTAAITGYCVIAGAGVFALANRWKR